MSSQPPQVDTGIDEVTGSTWTAVQGDGGHVIITASHGCPPWLVTLAARQLKQHLMPGGWDAMRQTATTSPRGVGGGDCA